MLKNASEIIGMTLEANDGKVGKVKDLLIDERWWTVRYLVADTGSWLSEHQVLVSPHRIVDSISSIVEGVLNVRASKAEIEAAPPLDADAPVSRRYELEHARHFGHSPYWLGSEVWGLGALPELLPPPPEEQYRHAEALENIENCHLFSASELMGYEVQHANGEVEGKIDDFVLACVPWKLHWLTIDLGHWFDKHPVCVPPTAIKKIDWMAKRVILSTTVTEPAPEPLREGGIGELPATSF